MLSVYGIGFKVRAVGLRAGGRNAKENARYYAIGDYTSNLEP